MSDLRPMKEKTELALSISKITVDKQGTHRGTTGAHLRHLVWLDILEILA